MGVFVWRLILISNGGTIDLNVLLTTQHKIDLFARSVIQNLYFSSKNVRYAFLNSGTKVMFIARKCYLRRFDKVRLSS